MTKIVFQKILIRLLLFCVAGSCAYISLKLHNNSIKDKSLKKDYFIVNQIKYGMLSGDNWSLQVNKIIEQQVDSFSFDRKNKKLLTAQINSILERLFDEVDVVLHKKQYKLKDKVKFKIINAFVDINKFKKEIPKFSQAIIDEMDKLKNKNQLKEVIKDKITGLLITTHQDIVGEQQDILDLHSEKNIQGFNEHIAFETNKIMLEQKTYAHTLIGLLAFTLIFWLLMIRLQVLYVFSFLFSVIISCIALFIGVSLPMLEIDARIATFDLSLLSSHIIFKDQVIFFQTKSILDVVHILVTDGKGDTVFVGCLILLFSVVFPIAKLFSAVIYLFKRERSSRFVKYMAFESGKWSMADVMVVAIFMAYIGFQGILNNQLEDINKTGETINVITTNKSGLQTGFLIFVAFVLYNLLLSEVLKRITRDDLNKEKKH